MKLGIIITQTDPETVLNGVRPALYSLEQGDEVRIFLSGRGVEINQIEDAKFNVKVLVQKVLNAGGAILACGACLKLRDSKGHGDHLIPFALDFILLGFFCIGLFVLSLHHIRRRWIA